jgi:uncharacterized OsmC-like protein
MITKQQAGKYRQMLTAAENSKYHHKKDQTEAGHISNGHGPMILLFGATAACPAAAVIRAEHRLDLFQADTIMLLSQFMQTAEVRNIKSELHIKGENENERTAKQASDGNQYPSGIGNQGFI